MDLFFSFSHINKENYLLDVPNIEEYLNAPNMEEYQIENIGMISNYTGFDQLETDVTKAILNFNFGRDYGLGVSFKNPLLTETFSIEIKKINILERFRNLLQELNNIRYGIGFGGFKNISKSLIFNMPDVDILNMDGKKVSTFYTHIENQLNELDFSVRLMAETSLDEFLFKTAVQIKNQYNLNNIKNITPNVSIDLLLISPFLFSYQDWKYIIINYLKINREDFEDCKQQIKSLLQEIIFTTDSKYFEDFSDYNVDFGDQPPKYEISKYVGWVESLKIENLEKELKNIKQTNPKYINKKIIISKKASFQKVKKGLIKYIKCFGVEVNERRERAIEGILCRMLDYETSKEWKEKDKLKNYEIEIDFLPEEFARDFARAFLYLQEKDYVLTKPTPILEVLSIHLKGLKGFSLRNLKKITERKISEEDKFKVSESDMKFIINNDILYGFDLSGAPLSKKD